MDDTVIGPHPYCGWLRPGTGTLSLLTAFLSNMWRKAPRGQIPDNETVIARQHTAFRYKVFRPHLPQGSRPGGSLSERC